MAFEQSLIGFLASLIISSIVIYIAAKLLGETEGVGTAILAALIGAIIYSLAYYFTRSRIFGNYNWRCSLVGCARHTLQNRLAEILYYCSCNMDHSRHCEFYAAYSYRPALSFLHLMYPRALNGWLVIPESFERWAS